MVPISCQGSNNADKRKSLVGKTSTKKKVEEVVTAPEKGEVWA